MLTWGWNLFVAEPIRHSASWAGRRLVLLPILGLTMALMTGCAGSDKRNRGFRSPTLPAASEAVSTLPLSGGIVSAASGATSEDGTSSQTPINSDLAGLAFEIQTLRHRFEEMEPSIRRLMRVEKDMSVLIAEMEVLMEDPMPLETPVAMTPEPAAVPVALETPLDPEESISPETTLSIAGQSDPAADTPTAQVSTSSAASPAPSPAPANASPPLKTVSDMPIEAPFDVAASDSPVDVPAMAVKPTGPAPAGALDLATLAEKLQLDTTPANGPESWALEDPEQPENEPLPHAAKTATPTVSGVRVEFDLGLFAEPVSEPEIESGTGLAIVPGPQPEADHQTTQAQAPIPPSPTGSDTGSVPQSCNGYGVHLGSYRKESSMASARISLAAKYPQVLSGLRFERTEVDLGERGVFIRMIVGPLAGKADARTVCGILRENGEFCDVVPFKGVSCVASAD